MDPKELVKWVAAALNIECEKLTYRSFPEEGVVRRIDAPYVELRPTPREEAGRGTGQLEVTAPGAKKSIFDLSYLTGVFDYEAVHRRCQERAARCVPGGSA